MIIIQFQDADGKQYVEPFQSASFNPNTSQVNQYHINGHIVTENAYICLCRALSECEFPYIDLEARIAVQRSLNEK